VEYEAVENAAIDLILSFESLRFKVANVFVVSVAGFSSTGIVSPPEGKTTGAI
jgi:hypothetical protein